MREGYRNRGIEALLFANGIEVALSAGYTWCEYSWILEDNDGMNRILEKYGATIKTVYRILERAV